VGTLFNGTGEVKDETGGIISGTLSVPGFVSDLGLPGVPPISLGIALAEVGPLSGTLARTGGTYTLTLPAQLSMTVNSLEILGVKLSTSCSTSLPVALQLQSTLSPIELTTGTWNFAGRTALATFRCQSGPLGSLEALVLDGLLSGQEVPYSLSFSRPSG
jgi:hypothetical protein